jgi:predicted AAA+ superfamily ATPase
MDDDQFVWQKLHRHFSAERVNSLTSSRRRYASHLTPDLQSAIASEIAGRDAELFGFHQSHDFSAPTLSGLLLRDERSASSITPLQYQDMNVGEDAPFAAMSNGVWLFHAAGEPIAILVSDFKDVFDRGRWMQVEIAHPPSEKAGAFARGFLSRLQQAAETSRLYRGKVLSFEAGSDYSGMRSEMLVHRLPTVRREDVILPETTMARLDRHVFEFDRHRDALKRLGQSTRKGVLLYGPPGTGKTHVIRYISSALSDHTTVLITAEQVANLPRYMTLARTLQPSIVVLEDVDLVGRAREEMNSVSAEALLNRLLNEMDGLQSDADILFILTTNRPEDIEEALASRPGRVDEAIEIAPPDALCRRRLTLLYGAALTFEAEAVDLATNMSEGASAAFMKEMVRRLAQRSLALEQNGHVRVKDVEAVFGDAAAQADGLGRRIVGLSPQTPARHRDECC